MNDYVFVLLVLSHVFMVPSSDTISLLWDAPCFNIFCLHLILKNFKAVSVAEGWEVMKKSHSKLGIELVESVSEVDLRK
ncbi:hypothetical protein FRX31_013060 [Thalictrum thalictroides]|uniref:Uncharacterized protein n=1 Tax=Thalictrum thalictroides TaxID=46969 RepID=A0A7J6WKD2_THATH|nr:hypothetical protein FRX31_013060 [Thalictrum thalictroides]